MNLNPTTKRGEKAHQVPPCPKIKTIGITINITTNIHYIPGGIDIALYPPRPGKSQQRSLPEHLDGVSGGTLYGNAGVNYLLEEAKLRPGDLTATQQLSINSREGQRWGRSKMYVSRST